MPWLIQIAALFLCSVLSFVAQASASFSSRVDHYAQFEGEDILPRNVSVWLPASYFSSPNKQYSVVYAHDGQNLFFPQNSYAGVTWNLENTLLSLSKAKKIKDVIVVGIWSTKHRRMEYFPSGAKEYVSKNTLKRLMNHAQGEPRGDEYISFIVKTLKPFIDANYRTLKDRDNTFLLGSSMGGVISLYAATNYPDVFSGAACLSTHWPLNHYIQVSDETEIDELAEAYITYLEKNLPAADSDLRLYFDYGDQGVDAKYAPYQKRIDALLKKRKYKNKNQWQSHYFPGADHNEQSWAERLEIPLEFILRK